VTTNPQRQSYLASAWPWLSLLLLLAGFALRTYQLAVQSLWYDEAISWYLTQMPLPQLTEWTANDIQPPLYYYLLWLWVRLAGISEFALRFPSVACGLLTLPLLWRLARRLFGPRAGWLALLLAVLSPLHVYYAQEARMYTLLTLLGVLSSYMLLVLLDQLRPVSAPGSQREWKLLASVYVLTATAALYTHYFAFFLLAAHTIYVVYRLRAGARADRRSPEPTLLPRMPIEPRAVVRRLDRRVLLIPVVILILYLPWLPYLVGRYDLDASYWPGALKIDEVARKLFITFGLGETVKEHIGIWLAAGYAVILIVGIAVLAAAADAGAPTTHRATGSARGRLVRPAALAFLLAYLLVPVTLVLALAYRTPKFNPRYAMVAWPAFVLLLGGGLSALVDAPPLNRGSISAIFGWAWRWRRVGFMVGLGFIIATSAYALANWYAPYRDNQFNKADFRITAGIVRDRLGADETVLLSSGHMFPAWAYYFGWEGWYALPEIQVLDVTTALDLSVARHLDELLAGRRGVWLVRWQNETTDPFDVLPLLLDATGAQDDYGQFWHMELHHYALPAEARFSVDTFVTRPVAATFGGQVRLLGVRVAPPADGRPDTDDHDANLVLVWQALAPPDADYAVFVHLLDDSEGVLAVADHQPARPMRQWPPGAVLPDRTRLAPPAGLPDGSYYLAIGLYDAAQPDLPRLGPVLADATGQLQPGERVLVPVTLRAGHFE
jgi:hypothetical protein